MKNIKKKLIGGLLLTSLVGISSVAFADEYSPNDGYFLKGQVGVSNAHVDANKPAAAIFGGYRWDVGNNFSVGPEVGYEHIGKYSTSGPGYKVSEKLGAVKVGADAQYQINDRWYVGAHAGYAQVRARVHVSEDGFGSYHDSDHVSGWYTGARVGYNIDRNVSLFTNVDYTRANGGGDTHASANTYTVGIQYNFGS